MPLQVLSDTYMAVYLAQLPTLCELLCGSSNTQVLSDTYIHPPRQVFSDEYVPVYLAQLRADGYSMVRGAFPPVPLEKNPSQLQVQPCALHCEHRCECICESLHDTHHSCCLQCLCSELPPPPGPCPLLTDPPSRLGQIGGRFGGIFGADLGQIGGRLGPDCRKIGGKLQAD